MRIAVETFSVLPLSPVGWALTVEAPTPRTRMSLSSRRTDSPPVAKMATVEPGFTKPATRSGSPRASESAILPSGSPRPDTWSGEPHCCAMICWPV